MGILESRSGLPEDPMVGLIRSSSFGLDTLAKLLASRLVPSGLEQQNGELTPEEMARLIREHFTSEAPQTVTDKSEATTETQPTAPLVDLGYGEITWIDPDTFAVISSSPPAPPTINGTADSAPNTDPLVDQIRMSSLGLDTLANVLAGRLVDTNPNVRNGELTPEDMARLIREHFASEIPQTETDKSEITTETQPTAPVVDLDFGSITTINDDTGFVVSNSGPAQAASEQMSERNYGSVIILNYAKEGLYGYDALLILLAAPSGLLGDAGAILDKLTPQDVTRSLDERFHKNAPLVEPTSEEPPRAPLIDNGPGEITFIDLESFAGFWNSGDLPSVFPVIRDVPTGADEDRAMTLESGFFIEKNFDPTYQPESGFFATASTYNQNIDQIYLMHNSKSNDHVEINFVDFYNFTGV